MDIIGIGRGVLANEAEAVATLQSRIGTEFREAVELLYASRGRVIVFGMGKSGQIARKIAATLTSTGTPALYIHPGDGIHGDLGMLSAGDVVLVVSNSGETEEILKMLPTVKVLQIPVVAILGRVASSLGRRASIVLDASVEREACPMDLAPTTSTTAALAMGDALAMALLELRDFKPEDFALFHPGGALGKKLLTTVETLMHSGEALPLVHGQTLMQEAILVMTEKSLGAVGVVDDSGRLIGCITDGDLRRGLEQGHNLLTRRVDQVMTKDPKWVTSSDLAVRALVVMEDHAITALFVVDGDGGMRPKGLIHIHDVLRAGIRR